MNPGVYPDYDDLGARLRGIDKLEVAAVNQWSPEVAIRNSIRISSKWWVGTINGVEEMVVGVAPVQGMDRWGAPWMLSSDKFLHSPGAAKDFLKRSKHFVDECAEGYDVLFNLISEHNHASRRWLRFAGFSIKERPWHTFKGFRFLEFIRVTPGGHYDLDNLNV
jgi:hypothetical protein